MVHLYLSLPLGLLLVLTLWGATFEKVSGSVVVNSDPQIRQKRTVGRGRNRQGPNLSQQLSSMLQGMSGSGSNLLSNYAPSTPRPEDVNCYVEVPTTTMVGGRCVSMGGQSYMCQAGAYLAFSSQCLNANSTRQRRTNGNSMSRNSAFQMLGRRRFGRN